VHAQSTLPGMFGMPVKPASWIAVIGDAILDDALYQPVPGTPNA
jgi:hypothetical protein